LGFSPPQQNPRSTGILAVAKANNLDIEIVNTDTEKPSDEFLKANPLSKVPTFVGADGYVLSECIAIAIYGTYETLGSHFAPLPAPPRWSFPPSTPLDMMI